MNLESALVNLVLTEGTGEEEKEIKRENGFSFPLNSEAYNSLALTEEEIEELKNPPIDSEMP